MYIDFQELKGRVSIIDVANLLKLSLTEHHDQLRGPCPQCKEGGDRALVITPAKGAYYCFAVKKGGDCIALAAHILDRSMRDAAQYIAEHMNGEPPPQPAPVVEEPEEHRSVLEPLAYLIPAHETVQALGIDVDVAKCLGIGYAKKGIMRGRVAIPLRTEEGTLLGYCGFAEEGDPPLKFPKNLVGS
jgi:DNA primase